jgi:hypothetical protein
VFFFVSRVCVSVCVCMEMAIGGYICKARMSVNASRRGTSSEMGFWLEIQNIHNGIWKVFM